MCLKGKTYSLSTSKTLLRDYIAEFAFHLKGLSLNNAIDSLIG